MGIKIYRLLSSNDIKDSPYGIKGGYENISSALTTPFYKKETVTETATETLKADLVEEGSSCVEPMTCTGESPREIKAAGTTWAELRRTSQNRVRWRGAVAALCSTRNQEA